MESINYKFLESHKKSHLRILSKIREMTMHLKANDTMIEDYASTLEDLFFKHIDYQDMQYADYISVNKINTENIY